MKLNKCYRCGAFFSSENEVCPNCINIDAEEKSRLKGFIKENSMPESVESLSVQTGITTKNIDRFLKDSEFDDVTSKLGNNFSGNINVQL